MYELADGIKAFGERRRKIEAFGVFEAGHAMPPHGLAIWGCLIFTSPKLLLGNVSTRPRAAFDDKAEFSEFELGAQKQTLAIDCRMRSRQAILQQLVGHIAQGERDVAMKKIGT